MITIAFCIPGTQFSDRFLRSWTILIEKLSSFEVIPVYSWVRGSNVFDIRNKAIYGTKTGGEQQTPFQGRFEYDYIMWIDSDQVFEPKHFKILLDTMQSSNKIHILSGLYYAESKKHFYAASLEKKSPFKNLTEQGFLTPKDVKGRKRPVKVTYNGMGFMMVRQGVFENIKYPWFQQLRYSNPNIIEFTGEDVSFCAKAKEAGFDTYIHPEVIVGHEKSIVIN